MGIKNIIVRELVFEVTRRCNMSCKHCLRGDAENKDILHDAIFNTIEQIDYIYHISFSGGEPSLYPKGIKETKLALEKYQKELATFYIVTNGKIKPHKMIKELDSLYNSCTNKRECSLQISKDQFHENIDDSFYYCIPYYGGAKTEYLQDSQIMLRGKAKDNRLKGIHRDIRIPELDIYEEEVEIDLLYISATGDILFDCDIAFRDQPNLRYGNILEDKLKDVLDTIIKDNDFINL
jgi:organic radical activating enzyme